MSTNTYSTPAKPSAANLPNPLIPASYNRRVLLAVCGLSPQVVTETLYALATAKAAAFVPTEVHLITTTEGARRAELSLLSHDLGWFHKLCADYQLDGIAFDASHIHVMQSSSGQPMDDIRTDQDNRDAANFMTAQVRHITADPACALHVSIAGGRKTMGFYLGYALSLYGRSQDRLSHVLVSEPFESSWDFFYPTPASRTLKTKDGTLADTATATVTLADIPFVSLRHATAMVDGNASFDETVQAARKALAPARLTLDLRGRRIQAGEQVVALSPTNLALLSVFARRVIHGLPSLRAPSLVPEDTKKNEGSDKEWSKRFLLEYCAITDSDSLPALTSGMDGTYFSERKSKLEKRLKAALGPAASVYCIHASGDKSSRVYALDLLPDAVVFASVVANKEEK